MKQARHVSIKKSPVGLEIMKKAYKSMCVSRAMAAI